MFSGRTKGMPYKGLEEFMRRNEKEVTDLNEIEAIIQEASVCRLGLAVDTLPYVVPVNFGYRDKVIYIHCAKKGRKLDMIRLNSLVCFEMDVDDKIVTAGDIACKWTASYRSVIGYGQAEIIEDFHQKKEALTIIMAHYSGKEDFEYKEKAIQEVGIIKITVTQMSGKKSD
jgi:uncharacterized protein